MATADCYEVLYSKGGKSKKRGYLIIQRDSRWLWLKTPSKETVRKGKVDLRIVHSIKEDNQIELKPFTIEIVKKLQSSPSSVATLSTAAEVRTTREPIYMVPTATQTTRIEHNKSAGVKRSNIQMNEEGEKAAIPAGTTVESFTGALPSLDPSLLDMMREHQIYAANFLLNRLLGKDYDADTVGNSNDHFSSASGGASIEVHSNPYASSELAVTGAILADEMGLGKSLTALSVLWAFIRKGRCKGIIVCPSSLVENWKAEINRWLRDTLAKRAIYVKNWKKKTQISEFVSSDASTRPLLVISYESFRGVSEILNRIRSLEIIVCDEGHRLKNANLTDTSLALGNCCAMRRLVLTGTPVQNNLDELFAVVNFVCPGYLGTLEEYRQHFADPISGMSDATEAKSVLKQLLKRILLRRLRDSVLSAILPSRRTYIIHCALSEEQKRYYTQSVDTLYTASKTNHNSRSSTGNGGDASSADTKVSVCSALPLIMQLRLCTSSPKTISGDEKESKSNSDRGDGGAEGDENAKREENVDIDKANQDKEQDTVDSYARYLLHKSGKYQVLGHLLQSIHNANPVEPDRVVVVSNFNDVLDDVAALVKTFKWGYHLRIDGTVAVQKRMKFVNLFNMESQPFSIMLLGAKSGGVGLNLVGANRLIMLDPDWNPATDQQAMGRIWRDGQKKPVFIYRLMCPGTIEETMIYRQKIKGLLSDVIEDTSADDEDEENDNDGNEDEDKGEEKGKGKGKKTRREEDFLPEKNSSRAWGFNDVTSMVYPQGIRYFEQVVEKKPYATGLQDDPILKVQGAIPDSFLSVEQA